MERIEIKDLLAVDGGLGFILHRFPQAVGGERNARHTFKMHDEKTPSAKMKFTKSGVWIITDFGEDSEGRNAVELEMYHSNVDFITALNTVAAFYNFKGAVVVERKPAMNWRKALPDEIEGEYYIEVKEFTEAELKVIFKETAWKALHREADKRFDAAKALCAKYHLKSLQKYWKVKNGQVTECSRTDEYPIFYFDEDTFGKIYTPADKECRFRYKGRKPQRFVHGLEQHRKQLVELKKKKLQEEAADAQEEFEATAEQKAKEMKQMKEVKLPAVTLCSGGSDALNVAAFGEMVIWLNSETEKLEEGFWKELGDMFKEVYQLQDIDDTGIKAAHAFAMEYLDLRTIWLPIEMTKQKKADGKPIYKDLRDWLEWRKDDRSPPNGYAEFKNLMKTALMYRFWDEQDMYDKHGKKKFKFERPMIEYVPNNLRIYNFLARNGFGRLERESEKDNYIYVQAKDNVVTEMKPSKIKDFLNDFLAEKNANEDLRNTFFRTPQTTETSLSNLPIVELDFKLYGADFQYYIFEKAVWKVTAKGIEEVRNTTSGKYVWKDKVLKLEENFGDYKVAKKPTILPSPWKIEKDANGAWQIEILNTDCLFMRFLMQTCRISWQKELEERLRFFEFFDTPEKQKQYLANNGFGEAELEQFKVYSMEENQQKYLDKFRYSLDGDLLTDEERNEQKAYFINRIYTIGYLLHRYKFRDRAWVVINMDARQSEQGEANGRAGKSIQSYAIRQFCNTVTLPGRADNLEKDPFIYQSVTKETDLVLIDDVKPNLDFTVFYEPATSDMTVNPKNTKAFTIGYNDSPKFCFNTNFGDSDTSGSSKGRKLMSVFSDYYHEKTEKYQEARNPVDDLGKRLFDDFTVAEWNLFYNTAMRCVEFYLAAGAKVDAPIGAVEKRAYLSIMSDNFKGWADVYFSNELGRLNKLVIREEAQEEYRKYSQLKLTPQSFFKRMKAFCAYYGYIFNPEVLQNEQKRIIRRMPGHTSGVECLYVQARADAPLNDVGSEDKFQS